MLDRTPQRLLAYFAVFQAVIIVIILYSQGFSQISHVLHEQHDTYQERYLKDKIQDSSGNLTNIQSGSSTIYVNEFGRVAIPPAKTLASLDIKELEETLFRYIENIQTPCTRMFHMGNEKDGGYHVCETYLKPGNCLVYSFGIYNDFSFDDAVAKTYGCEVHSFDPGSCNASDGLGKVYSRVVVHYRDGQKDHKRSDKVTFHCIGIGGEDKNIMVKNVNWKIMTFDSIKSMLGHTGTRNMQKGTTYVPIITYNVSVEEYIKHTDSRFYQRKLDIVKIDTEAAEWDSLENMIKTGVINDINILILELHVWLDFKEKLAIGRTPERYRRYLTIIRGMYESGFRTYYFRMWTPCHYEIDGIGRTACHEVHFVNIDRSRFD